MIRDSIVELDELPIDVIDTTTLNNIRESMMVIARNGPIESCSDM